MGNTQVQGNDKERAGDHVDEKVNEARQGSFGVHKVLANQEGEKPVDDDHLEWIYKTTRGVIKRNTELQEKVMKLEEAFWLKNLQYQELRVLYYRLLEGKER